MSKSYAQIVKQIEVLKLEADKVRRKEIEGVVSRIRQAISVYGLTADDLGFGAAKVKRGRKAAKPAPKAGRKSIKATTLSAEIKYRNEAGAGWVGRGKRPQWLRDALAAGKQLSDFAVR